jgi:hypothetical protein
MASHQAAIPSAASDRLLPVREVVRGCLRAFARFATSGAGGEGEATEDRLDEARLRLVACR